MMNEVDFLEIGVVIAGAGARGAYEAGLLAHLLPEVAWRVQSEGQVARFSFIGTSAGSLNTALIASRAPSSGPDDSPSEVRDRWVRTMREVTDVWGQITEHRVLDLKPDGRLLGAVSRVIPGVHWPLASVLNIDPLVRTANDPRIVSWEALHERVACGTVGAVGVAATARDGRTVVFLDRRNGAARIPRDERRDIDYADVDHGISAQHVLASSAIPMLFPAQRVTDPDAWSGWYYDGGVRLNTPLKPALLLGVERLIIVGTHPDRYVRESPPDPRKPAPEVDEAVLPVASQLMADQIIQDLHALRGGNAAVGIPTIGHLFAGPPSFDTLAELSRTAQTSLGLNTVIRRILAGDARWELSSYLLFETGYLRAAVTAGHQRAEEILPHGTDPVPWIE
jgi:NTE family protein